MVGTFSKTLEKVKGAYYIHFSIQKCTDLLTWPENEITLPLRVHCESEVINYPIYMVSGHKKAVFYEKNENYY